MVKNIKGYLGKTIDVTIDRPLNSLHPKHGFKYEVNYAPWAIKAEDFPERGSLYDQLKFRLGFAILAPSGHLW